MSTIGPNPAASVHRRLLNLARSRNEEFGFLLTLYGLERLLYRLSRSQHRTDFVLKGALLLRARTGEAHRHTRDLDLLGRGDSSTARLERVFADLWALPVPEDGLALQEGSIRSEEIREAQEYGGVRVTMTARLGNARIPIQVDVGFGDAVTPGVEEIAFPTLLDASAPRLLAYPMETVLAEKLQALVMLGVVNTRMKDFYDLWMLSRGFDFEGPTVVRAISATFRRRQTAIPAEVPVGLTPEFGEDAGRQRQWAAFLSRTNVRDRLPVFADVVAVLRGFLMPPLQALASSSPFAARWPAGGPWTSD